MKKISVILLSAIFILSFSAMAFAEDDTTTPSTEASSSASTSSSVSAGLSGVGDLLGSMLTGDTSSSSDSGGLGDSFASIFESFGLDLSGSDFDVTGMLSGLNSLGDIDFSKFFGEMNMDSFLGGFSDIAGGILGGSGSSLDIGSLLGGGDISSIFGSSDISGIFGDLGTGSLTNIFTDGLGSLTGLLGIGSGSSGDADSDGGSGGFSDIISSVAGSIADMSGNFDILDFFGGLLGNSSGSDNSSGTNNESLTGVDNSSSISDLPTSSNSSGNQSSNYSPILSAPSVDVDPVTEITTQEFTTIRQLLVEETTAAENGIPGQADGEKSTKGTVAAGIILVLGSFGSIAYIVIKKVL